MKVCNVRDSSGSFQQHWILWLHGRSDDFQDADAHLRGQFGRDTLFVAREEGTFFRPNVSFKEVRKLSKQRGQLQFPDLPQSLNKFLQFPVLVDQLVDRGLAILNPTHGGKDDFFLRFEVRFQITLKETDDLIRSLTEPTHISLMILDPSMNSETHEQAIVMLAGQRDEALMTPV